MKLCVLIGLLYKGLRVRKVFSENYGPLVAQSSRLLRKKYIFTLYFPLPLVYK